MIAVLFELESYKLFLKTKTSFVKISAQLIGI
jgi:hypothetical protein